MNRAKKKVKKKGRNAKKKATRCVLGGKCVVTVNGLFYPQWNLAITLEDRLLGGITGGGKGKGKGGKKAEKRE